MKLRVPYFATLVLGLLSLASCGDPQGADGYTMEPGAEMIDPRPIVVRTYPDYQALRAAYEAAPGQKRKLGESEQLFAFASIGQICTIHQIRPTVAYRPEEFGHELTHCLYGNFHPGQDERG